MEIHCKSSRIINDKSMKYQLKFQRTTNWNPLEIKMNFQWNNKGNSLKIQMKFKRNFKEILIEFWLSCPASSLRRYGFGPFWGISVILISDPARCNSDWVIPPRQWHVMVLGTFRDFGYINQWSRHV